MENKLTIIDCVVKLINHFSTNTDFNLNKDYRSVIGLTANDDKYDKALMELALNELEHNGVVKKITINKDVVAFLKKPIDNIDQQILISYQTSNLIAEKINYYCKLFKNERDFCNPVGLKEKDIINLINILTFLENKATEKNNLTKEE